MGNAYTRVNPQLLELLAQEAEGKAKATAEPTFKENLRRQAMRFREAIELQRRQQSQISTEAPAHRPSRALTITVWSLLIGGGITLGAILGAYGYLLAR